MLIDGKTVAQEIGDELGRAISSLSGRSPGLAVILVGDHPASMAYVSRKTAECDRLGIASTLIHLPAATPEPAVVAEIDKLNVDPTVDGILVQLPLPPSINEQKIMLQINPRKDVDGFHPMNMGRLLAGDTGGFVPCTPLGIVELLQRTEIPVAGRHVVIVGRSTIVGKPLAALLVQKRHGCNATVTIAHSATTNLSDHTTRADILVVAIGSPGFIHGPMVKEGATVIDVGINRVPDPSSRRGYRLVGDVVFDEVVARADHLTPVPGGVGPMTVAMLMQNTWTSYLRNQEATLLS